jgi:probable rRNA maturation factor
VPDDDPGPCHTAFTVDLELAHPAWLDAWPDAERGARRAVCAALDAEPERLPRKSSVAVSVVLGDDALVRALNAAHRGKDKPTNVLSFPMARHFAFPTSETPLGDIVLAFETVTQEAEAGALSLADHATHLLIHGALHLLGFDHEKSEAARRMEAAEARILKRLGMSHPALSHQG